MKNFERIFSTKLEVRYLIFWSIIDQAQSWIWSLMSLSIRIDQECQGRLGWFKSYISVFESPLYKHFRKCITGDFWSQIKHFEPNLSYFWAFYCNCNFFNEIFYCRFDLTWLVWCLATINHFKIFVFEVTFMVKRLSFEKFDNYHLLVILIGSNITKNQAKNAWFVISGFKSANK